MRQVFFIFNKEIKDYFISPIAYIVITLFLLVVGAIFFSRFFLYGQTDLRLFFNLLPYAFAVVVPLITMRLFSEELNVGSYELLLTLPVTFRDIILGKFFAAVVFIAAILLPTVVYAVIISFLGDLDWGVVAGSYIGALFLGAAFAAVGLFTSSMTRNQIIAAIVAVVICALLVLIDLMLFFVPQALLDVAAYLSANAHFKNIAKGIVDTRDLIYFLSLTFIGLYATNLVMQEK